MKSTIKTLIRKLVPRPLSRIITQPVIETYEARLAKGRISFSQEGEDLILDRYFCDKPTGFFVDVGAHHPWHLSNTYLLYSRGWKGINIDPRPGTMDVFNRERPNDINVEAAIGEAEETRRFYIFNEPTFSTFSKDHAAKWDGVNGWRIVEAKEIRVRTLASVLDDVLPPWASIDFISIDVEGLDMEVLRSNNWDKYRPQIVVVEQFGASLQDIIHSEPYAFLKNLGYDLYAKTVHTVFYSKPH